MINFSTIHYLNGARLKTRSIPIGRVPPLLILHSLIQMASGREMHIIGMSGMAESHSSRIVINIPVS